MLQRLLRKLKALFVTKTIPKERFDTRPRPTVQYGDKVGGVTISKPYQLDKHTAFKPGEGYRVGEGYATVHADKSSMYMALLRVDDKRFLRHEGLRKRAIDIMLMSVEELAQFKVSEWLASNVRKDNMFKRIMGRWWNKARTNYFLRLETKYPPQVPEQPEEESKDLIVEKVKEKV